MSRFGLRTRNGAISSFIEGVVGSTVDADAQAFFDRVTAAGGSLSLTEQNAVNALTVSLKTLGVWTLMKAIYPMVGASAAACAQNLKSSSFTGTFSSGWTFASTGATPNGTSAFMNTNLNENTTLTLNNTHISFYSRTDVAGLYCDIGLAGTGGTNIYPNFGGVFYPRVNAVNSGSSNNLNTAAFFISNRTDSTQVFGFRNLVKYTVSSSSVAKENTNIYLSCENTISSQSNFSPRQCSFSSIGDGLTDTQANDLYNSVQTFQTSLSRNI